MNITEMGFAVKKCNNIFVEKKTKNYFQLIYSRNYI